MISELSLIILLGIISYLYNILIYPYVVLLISLNLYNTILIFMVLIVQLDNFSLFTEINKLKTENNNINNIMEDKYVKIISNQLAFICKKQEEINTMTNKKKKRHMRSCSQ